MRSTGLIEIVFPSGVVIVNVLNLGRLEEALLIVLLIKSSIERSSSLPFPSLTLIFSVSGVDCISIRKVKSSFVSIVTTSSGLASCSLTAVSSVVFDILARVGLDQSTSSPSVSKTIFA